jgi:mono/diheme cytochrome c family protein
LALTGAAAAEEDGQALFNRKCATCHQQNGEGIVHAYPALAGDAFLLGDEDQLVALIFKGRAGMPAWSSFLKDDQVAQILTYVRGAWGNGAPAITAAKVAELRKTVAGASQSPVGN